MSPRLEHGSPSHYERRVIDQTLDQLLPGLAAIALDGAKGVGKTSTALARARTVYRLDDDAQLDLLAGDPSRLAEGPRPILLDEWQRLPSSWDLVRRAVDAGAVPGTFLLTGSARHAGVPLHSGAGRIVSLRMRPMTLPERGVTTATVSLARLLEGSQPAVVGATPLRMTDYAEEILRSGFPGIRNLPEAARYAQLSSYVDRIVERDFDEAGRPIRNPAALRRWLAAYAAATSTPATFEAIRDAATGGQGDKPAKSTTIPYRDVLERLWILDPLPAWLPTRNRLNRLGAAPKHHLADPALAAVLLGVDVGALLDPPIPKTPTIHRDGPLLGALFESLVALTVRVFAQASDARVSHLRTRGGDREVDLIVERRDGRVVAIEVKLTRSPGEADLRHLKWLQAQLGGDLLDAVVITTGPDAYRRKDGIAVVPAALLGP